jgi:phospholipid transport system substrate-binding protein
MFRLQPARRSLLRAAAVPLVVLALSATARAAVEPPDELVRSVADDVLKIVQQDRELRAGSQSKMAQLIEDKIVPHFDFQRMTRLAVRRSWRQATPEQQNQLVAEFRTLLVRSYSTAYSAYKDIEVEVKPLRLQPSDEDVVVHTLIKVPNGGQAVNVDYSMFKTSSGWKVYDVTVDGISLVTTYRSTFADQVGRAGIEGLVKALAEMNAAKTAPAPTGASKQ